MLTRPPESFLDDVSRLTSPDERRRVLIPVVDEGLDVLHEGLDRVEGSPTNGLSGQDTEPRLHHVQPGSSGWGEVERDTRVRRQPSLNLRCLVGGRVVEDDMQVARPIAPTEDFEKSQEVSSG